ncbi:MAG: C40 family peptidase [Actinomycetota bacterium]|nr:C40 family peptidase [Actinomycetota bacterium]
MSTDIPQGRRRRLIPALSTAVILAVTVSGVAAHVAGRSPRTSTTTTGLPGTTGGVREERFFDPNPVVVRDALGVVATFTTGARTATLRGPRRTFAESTTTATVATDTWVRLLDQPFTGTVDYAWLAQRLEDRAPDVLATAAQYITAAATLLDPNGRRYAGDAAYGLLRADGTRAEGSDFNDYLGASWTYGTYVDRPEADQYGSMDCSGYVRSVFGYRLGMPLSLRSDGVRLPRRAVQMLDSAPGVVVVPDTGGRPSSLSTLLPGDLVFFDASTDDGTLVDHVGIYLGTDSAKAARFLSSRKTPDGSTLGDLGGRSTLTGTGLYARSFRAVRRL